MPKTNHNRNFIDERDYTCPPGDHCRGKHGAATKKRGLKKYRRTRNRFYLNQQVPGLIDEDKSLEPSIHGRGLIEPHSKLRRPSDDGQMICTQCRSEVNYLRVVNHETKLCTTCLSKQCLI